jgi:cytochrome c oxidase subunit IV
MSAHVVPVRTYVTIFLLLMVLTATTVWVATVDLGPLGGLFPSPLRQLLPHYIADVDLNTLAALTIACIKMLLVVLFFMHVRQATSLTKVVILAGFFWLLLLMSFTLTDEGTRNLPPPPDGWGASTTAPTVQR